MNIFVICSDPKRNARILDNKRLVKMVLETAQLLSNAVHHYTGNGPYKISHLNHPCSVWVRESTGNYFWAIELFKELCLEYTRRYSKIHKSSSLLPVFEAIRPRLELMTEFRNCTDHKHLGVFEAYRNTMRNKWKNDKHPPSWKIKA